jgi:uncharacterized protein DUF3618
MSDSSRKALQPDAAELREDVQRTRRDLGDTVEALAHKADVPARAKGKANAVLDTTKAKAAVAKETVMAKAEQTMYLAQAKAADVSEQAQQTMDKLPPSAAQRVKRILAAIRQRPGVYVAGAIMSIALLRRVASRKRQD